MERVRIRINIKIGVRIRVRIKVKFKIQINTKLQKSKNSNPSYNLIFYSTNLLGYIPFLRLWFCDKHIQEQVIGDILWFIRLRVSSDLAR